MALTIFWTKRASIQFDDILDYPETEFGENSTRKFALNVHSFTDNLKDFPELGSIQNANKQIRGFVIVKQVSIFYKIFDGYIRILNIFDNRSRPRK